VIVIVVTMSLAATVLVMCRSMKVESMAAANQAAMVQASAVERGAEQYLQAMLITEGNDGIDENVTEDQFAAIQIGDGYFWVLRPDYDDPTLPVFGMVKEGAKLNLNKATYDQLMRLPGMTDAIARGWLDWRGDSSDTGALQYSKQAPFESVEETMMVEADTPEAMRELLYGIGGAPPLGQVSTGQTRGFNGTQYSDPQLARGIYDLLTVWSVTPSISTLANGENTIGIGTVSSSDVNALQKLFKDKGIASGRISEIMARIHQGDRFSDVFDFAVKAGLKADEFDLVYNNLRTGNSSAARAARPGLVDVNEAPRSVLLCLDGLNEDDVDKLIANRQTNNSPNTIGWVLTALGSRAQGLGLASKITGSSSQYSADILAVSGNGRAFKRVKIVIDNATGTPQIVFRRDLTDRGWPMDPQILASIRAGQGPGNWGGSSRGSGASPQGGSQMGTGGAF
jgi:hypothetical protein